MVCKNCGKLIENGTICPVCGGSAVAESKKPGYGYVCFGGLIGIVLGVIVTLIICYAGAGPGHFEEKFPDVAYNSWCEVSSDGNYMKIFIDDDFISYWNSDCIECDAWDAVQDVSMKLGFSRSDVNCIQDEVENICENYHDYMRDYYYYDEMPELCAEGREETDNYCMLWSYQYYDGLSVVFELED